MQTSGKKSGPRPQAAKTRPAEQGRSFIETARALGCDEDEVRFDAALGKIARHKPQNDPPNPAEAPKTKKPVG